MMTQGIQCNKCKTFVDEDIHHYTMQYRSSGGYVDDCYDLCEECSELVQDFLFPNGE